MIPGFTRTIFQQALDDWGRYSEKFNRLTTDEQKAFLKEEGFASLRDIQAHVAVWWEEGLGIIRDTIAQREHPSRKYDFDEFNAAALMRFKETPNADFLAWYEDQRQEMLALISSLTGVQFEIKRVQNWLNAVILEHLKEHCMDAPRFLTLDMLQRELGGVLEGFQALPDDKQKVFLEKQGFVRFRDLVAHVIAWWEDGLAMIDAVSKDPEYSPRPKDINVYNAEAVKLFDKFAEADVWKKYESTRQSLIELMINLPDDTFHHKLVQDWLRSDVILHYFEHAF